MNPEGACSIVPDAEQCFSLQQADLTGAVVETNGDSRMGVQLDDGSIYGNLNTPLCNGTLGYQSPGFGGMPGSYGDVPNSQSYQANKTTWKIGIDWKPTSDEMLYANIATGYKPGGFNPPSGFTTAPCCYQAENLVAYEVGFKGVTLPWLRLDSDLFYYNYGDMQVVSQLEIGNANFTQETINTPTRIYGMENLATATLTSHDTLTVRLNYLHTEFVDLYAGGNAGNPYVSWAGHVLDKSPKWTADLNYRHRFDLGAHGNVVLGINSSYTTEYYLNVISNNQTYLQDAFHPG